MATKYDDEKKRKELEENEENEEQQEIVGFDDNPPAPPAPVIEPTPTPEELEAQRIAKREEQKKEALAGASGNAKKLGEATINTGFRVADIKRQIADEDEKAEMEGLNQDKKEYSDYRATYDDVTEKTKKLNEELKERTQEARRVEEDANRDILSRYISDAELARKEHEIMTKAESNSILWTGVAELGAAIANLIGVANNASNQKIPMVSADWMKTADRNRKDRVRRLDSLKDRMNNIKLQMARLQSAGMKEDAGIDFKNSTWELGRREGAAQNALTHGSRIRETERAIKKAARHGRAEADITEAEALGRAQTQASGSSRGSGGGSGSGSGSGSGGGSVPSNAYKLRIGDRYYWMNDRAVMRNIQAIRNALQLSSDEEAELSEMMKKNQNEQAAYLLRKLNENPRLADILIGASYGEAEAVQSPQQPQGEQSFDGWLNG